MIGWRIVQRIKQSPVLRQLIRLLRQLIRVMPSETHPRSRSPNYFPLVVGKPNKVNVEELVGTLREITDTGILTNDGPFVKLLEERVSKYTGANHAIAVSNATCGIEWTLRALQLPPGGEVVVPSFTFIATAHAILAAGLTPVFCDVDRKTHLIEVAQVDKVVTPKTVAIVGVNLWGLMCTAALEAYAQEKCIPIMFDSAHSFGSRNGSGKTAGNMGCAEIVSLHATKLFNSFEGGLVITNDDALARKIVAMRNFGIVGQDNVEFIGTNCKLSEIHAAFACLQLTSIEQTKHIYHENAQKYSSELRRHNLRGVTLWNDEFLQTGCTHSYIILILEDSSPISRDCLMKGLREKEVYAKRYFFPGTHKYECYKAWPPRVPLDDTDWLNEHLLTLPTGTNIAFEDIERIVECVSELHGKACLGSFESEKTPTIGIDESYSATRQAYIEQKH